MTNNNAKDQKVLDYSAEDGCRQLKIITYCDKNSEISTLFITNTDDLSFKLCINKLNTKC